MRGWTLALGLAVAGAASAGCSLETRVTSLENQVKGGQRLEKLEESAALGSALLVKWHQSTLMRLSAAEQREERMRLEIAKLERTCDRLESELAAAKLSSAPAPSPKPTGPVAPEVPTSAPATATTEAPKASSDGYLQAGQKWGIPDRFDGKVLALYYATGQGKENIQGQDKEAGPAPVTKAPREPGKSGLDGQTLLGKELDRTRFLDSTGDTVDLSSWKGKKNVVLVVLRGFDGSVCIACSGQTLAISQNLDEFARRDAEVFLLYPGKAESVPIFLDAVRDLQGGGRSLPVDILLDVDLSVVRNFKIEGKLAKPTTVIIDKKGIVRFAHVGQSKTDRPTVPQMLDALDGIAKNEGK